MKPNFTAKDFPKIFIVLAVFYAVWGTSGTHFIAGAVMLLLSEAVFLLTFFKKTSPLEDAEIPTLSLETIKNPFFIPSVILILMGVIQILNPAYMVYLKDSVTYIKKLEHIKFLPSGISGDCELGVSLKSVAELFTGALFAVSIWMYRRDGRFMGFLLRFFAANCALMAVLAVAQLKSGANMVYWTFPSGASFYGTFYYVNSACAFLFLGFAAASASAVLDFCGKLKYIKLFAWILCGAAILCAIYFSSSVGAKMSAVLFAGFAIAIALFAVLRRFCGAKIAAAALAIAIFAAIPAAVYGLNRGFESLPKTKQDSLAGRFKMYEFSKYVFMKAPILGSGADSYQYIVQSHPNYKNSAFSGKNLNSPHNELIAFACEYGVVGAGAVVGAFILWGIAVFKSRRVLGFATALIAGGVAVSVIHSRFDLFYHEPSVMIALCLMMALAAAPMRKFLGEGRGFGLK